MTGEKLTIKEIAKLAGVSQTAVSFVINGKDGVSDATREKIQSVIKMTGYAPNASSQRLIMKKSFNIALLYPRTASPFSDLFYNEIAGGLTQYLTNAKYNVVFVPIQEQSGSELPDIIRRHDADGAVFFQGADPSLLDKLDGMDFPYILLDLHENDERHIHVSLDCEQFIQMSVEYLAAKGHTRLAFLGSDTLPSYYIRCFSGYQKALIKLGLPVRPEWIQIGANDQPGVRQAVESLYSSDQRPTAVCCMSDIIAIQAMQFARQSGIPVPGELSFISIDDIVISQYAEPMLTCVSYDKQSMGGLAGQILLDKLGGRPVQSHIITDCAIVERASVSDRTGQ